jgi:heme/copper-type cytochrome/quinol oxidase subunit 3
MEIPYTVTAREDTGLWNAKLGIWLFLASEVMLFGGLFSGYIFLRLGAGADPLYHWPTQELKVWPGFINTLVLIGSSVTVVMAWASLKMRKWEAYRRYMFITLGCALAFMCIKTYEYYGKFTHSSVRLVDGTVVDGHIHQDVLLFEAVDTITVPTENPDLSFLKKYAFDSHGAHHESARGGNSHSVHPEGEAGHGGPGQSEEHAGAGESQLLTPEGEVIKHLDLHIREIQLLPADERPNSLSFKISPPVTLGVKPSMAVSYDERSFTLRNGATAKGRLVDDTMHIKVDAVDLRNLEDPAVSTAWDLLSAEHKQRFLSRADEKVSAFNEKHPDLDHLGIPEARKQAFVQKFKTDEEKQEVAIPREDIRFYSAHTPKWNTYYAIYFTMTGLHGLHVIGGALVLAHFTFFGRRIYDRNPEHLCNRVEVGGLFWHFVDLVWIFLFPIMYLL